MSVSSHSVLTAGLASLVLMAGCSGEAEPPSAPEVAAEEPARGTELEKETAAPTVQDRYLEIYTTIRQADNDFKDAEWETAREGYRHALERLQTLPSDFGSKHARYRIKYVEDRLAEVDELIKTKGRLPELGPPADGDPQAWFVRIQAAMKEARGLAFADEEAMAYRTYKACLRALDELPPDFNRFVVASRRETCREQIRMLGAKIAREAQATNASAEGQPDEAQSPPETAPEAAAMTSLIPGFSAPNEGQQGLLLAAVQQVRTARRLQEEGRLKPALHEFQEALKKMERLDPKLKDGDGGPDDDVRRSIRELQRKLK
ncbi:MAG: hypothetical protein AAGK14_00970 [Verrucomicrobiota bacterium]